MPVTAEVVVPVASGVMMDMPHGVIMMMPAVMKLMMIKIMTMPVPMFVVMMPFFSVGGPFVSRAALTGLRVADASEASGRAAAVTSGDGIGAGAE